MAKSVYTTKQVADNLGIVTSTLRKWALLLEQYGYKFERNEKNQRMFFDSDMLALRNLKELTQQDGMSLENAVKSIADKGELREEISLSDFEDNSKLEAKLDELLEYVKRQDERIEMQEQFNKELIKRLEEQNKYIANSMEKRDQQLMLAMREVQETKKLIAASEEESKGFFARLFRK
mgnify:CR=1 FL=1